MRLILEQPATSRFIARRLFEYFACLNPEEETVDRLATVLRRHNYELEPMLRNLFLSEEFYSERVTGCQIKSPVELVVGTLRDLGVDQVTNYSALEGAIRQMGQQLLEPPDVKGWRYGRTWISSSRLFVRYNSVAELINSVPQPGGKGVDGVAILEASGCKTSAELVDYLAKRCLMKPLTQDKRTELIDFLGELPQKTNWTKQRDEFNEATAEPPDPDVQHARVPDGLSAIRSTRWRPHSPCREAGQATSESLTSDQISWSE